MMLTVPELDGTEWPEDHWPMLLICREELLDHEYAAYPHGVRATKVLGCTGPMCMKAARDYGRAVQRRLNGAQSERISAVRYFDAFLEAFTGYAQTYWQSLGVTAPKRRKLKDSRVYRRTHLIPLSTADKLHKSRARLAS